MDRRKGIYEKYVKRPLDFLLSLIALAALSPVFLVIAAVVRIKLGRPVIFKQERPGMNEKIFTLYKFRTMTDARDENGERLPDEKRNTKFGKLLRATSLDELPELWNIVRGDIAIVGPRPLIVEYLPYYNENEKHRHDVRPGLTGLAQISGRNHLTWEARFIYDLEYIKNISFKNDTLIILKTIGKVLRHTDITIPGANISFDDYRINQWEQEGVDK
jgi:undecaprenyl phosphate N,N'-diacetylbacillosamine 1-phosphate transferase